MQSWSKVFRKSSLNPGIEPTFNFFEYYIYHYKGVIRSLLKSSETPSEELLKSLKMVKKAVLPGYRGFFGRVRAELGKLGKNRACDGNF